MQPNKTILLKALDAANTSVKAQPPKTKSIADEKLEEIRSKRFGSSGSSEKIELFSASYQNDRELNNKRLRKFETHDSDQKMSK